jgi:hypothetical protein
MAWSLGGLGDVARVRAEYNRATAMFRESVLLSQSAGDKFGPPYTLEALGLVAAALGDAQRAARLWGAAASWREAYSEPLPLNYQQDYAPIVTQARTQLGDEAYKAAWSEGQAMSPEQAIALALEG